MNPLDEELIESMQSLFEILKEHPENADTDEQLKMRIVSSNLKALANVMLIADSKEEISLNLKQVALGLLGTAAYLSDDLPEIEGGTFF